MFWVFYNIYLPWISQGIAKVRGVEVRHIVEPEGHLQDDRLLLAQPRIGLRSGVHQIQPNVVVGLLQQMNDVLVVQVHLKREHILTP